MRNRTKLRQLAREQGKKFQPNPNPSEQEWPTGKYDKDGKQIMETRRVGNMIDMVPNQIIHHKSFVNPADLQAMRDKEAAEAATDESVADTEHVKEVGTAPIEAAGINDGK